MSKYHMDDGTLVDTERASASWDEIRRFDGRNMVGLSSGNQFHHQTLYRSRKGRYYIEYRSDWQGSRSHVEWVSPEEATRFMVLNEHELPEDLKKYVDELVE